MGRAGREHRGEHGDSAGTHGAGKRNPLQPSASSCQSAPKRVNAEANEAKRSRGNCFVARHLDEGTPAPES